MMMLMKSALTNHVVGSMIQADHLCSAVTCKLLCKAYIYNCTEFNNSLSEFIEYVSLKRDENPKSLKDLPPGLAHFSEHFTV